MGGLRSGRRFSAGTLSAGLATVALGAIGINPAAAAVVCGQSITSDTTLTANLTCPANGVFINASDVTLDLNGHTITGTKETPFTAGVTVSSGRLRARVTGGTIRGFNRAIGVSPGADGAHIHDMRLEDNELGIGLFEFTLGSFPRDARIVSNVITNPGPFSGLQLAGRGHVVQHNTITNGARNGIFLIGSDMLVANNHITDSGANGIAIGPSPGNPGPFTNNRLLGNRVSGSGRIFTSSSISIRSADGTVVSGNTVSGRPIAPRFLSRTARAPPPGATSSAAAARARSCEGRPPARRSCRTASTTTTSASWCRDRRRAPCSTATPCTTTASTGSASRRRRPP